MASTSSAPSSAPPIVPLGLPDASVSPTASAWLVAKVVNANATLNALELLLLLLLLRMGGRCLRSTRDDGRRAPGYHTLVGDSVTVTRPRGLNSARIFTTMR